MKPKVEKRDRLYGSGEPWRSVELGEIVRFRSGGTPAMSKPAYWGGNIPWLSAKDLKSFWLHDSQVKVSELGARSGTRIVPPDTVLILVRGMTLLKDVPIGVATRELTFNQDIKALEPLEGVDGGFIALSLVNERQRLMGLVSRSGHGTGRLATDILESFPLLLPPLGEQRGITTILRAWDRAIGQTERLIAAKRRHKQALMQQLLTGKRRFREFGEGTLHRTALGVLCADWPLVHMRDVFRRVTRTNAKGATRVLTASGEHGLVDQRDYFNRSVAGESLTGYYLLQQGEFAYNRSLMKGYPYSAIKRLDLHDEGVLSTLYLCFALTSPQCNSNFFAQFFESGLLNSQLREIAQVGARAHGLLNVTAGDFFDMRIPVPGLAEQNRIARFLNSCDREIENLRFSLNALKCQKKGLMKQLMTGRVRMLFERGGAGGVS